MAKYHKTNPAPTVPSVCPPEGATLEERTRYLLHEIGSEAGFLEQWIAHYLAELLERADDQKAESRARSEARAEIARVLPALWEQQIAREALYVRSEVDYWLRRSDSLDLKAEQALIPLLTSPHDAEDFDESELPYAFRALHTFAELLTRILLTTASAERARHEVTSEALRQFLQRDDEVQELRAAIARIIPDFNALDLTDLKAVGKLVQQTLLALTQAQLNLLNHVAQEDKEREKECSG